MRPLGPVLRSALLGGVPLLLWLSLAVVYYGFPYPNTAYAKLNVELPAGALASQGLWYLLDSLQRDPLTLLVIAVGVATAIRDRSREALCVAAGLLLYLAYVVRVGGDFMSGRFLTAPLMVAVVWLAARVLSSLGERELLALAAVVGLLGVSFPGGLAAKSLPDKGIPASGIVDERAWYQDSTGLMENVRIRKYEQGWQWRDARALRRKGVKVSVHPNVGLLGFAAGPGVTIVDGLALTDPLLARIPFRSNGDFRIGHFQRDLPAGYEETLRTGQNVIEDPCLREYYDLLSRVVRGPLFTVERWRAIFGLNFRVHDSLVNGTCKR